MLEWLASSAASGFLGTLLGGASSMVTRFLILKEKKLDHAHELAMRDKDIDERKMEAENELKITDKVEEGKVNAANAAAKSEAYRYDKRTYSNGVLEKWKPENWFTKSLKSLCIFLLVQVDIARGLIRPATTVAILYGTFHFIMWLMPVLKASIAGIDKSQTYAITIYVANFVFFSCSSVLSFWFCSRAFDSQLSAPSAPPSSPTTAAPSKVEISGAQEAKKPIDAEIEKIKEAGRNPELG